MPPPDHVGQPLSPSADAMPSGAAIRRIAPTMNPLTEIVVTVRHRTDKVFRFMHILLIAWSRSIPVLP